MNEPCQVQNDEAGYLKNSNGKYIYDEMGNMIKLSEDQISWLVKKNILKFI